MVKRIQRKIKIATQDLDKNIRIALYVVAGICLWMFTGLFSGDDKPEKAKRADVKNVAVYQTSEQPYIEMLNVSGRTEPEALALVGAQIEGSVEKIHAQLGDVVKKDQSLLTFSPSGRSERLDAAKAALKEAQVLYNAAKKLNKEGYRSDTTLATRLANLTAAKEALALAKKAVNDGNMLSPIDGLIVSQDAQEGQYLSKGQTAFSIVNQEQFLIVAHIAQKDHAQVRSGQVVKAHLVNGQEIEGTVRAISNHADDITKTYRMEVLVDGSKYAIPTGMTAKLEIPIQETQAHFIPQNALVIGQEGRPGIKIVDDKNTVRFKEIQWFENLQTGLWVTGLPAQTHVIVRGQNLANDGEIVNMTVLEKENSK